MILFSPVQSDFVEHLLRGQFDAARRVAQIQNAFDQPATELEAIGAKNNLAELAFETGHYAEARALYQTALSEAERNVELPDVQKLAIRGNLARLIRYLGLYREALDQCTALLTEPIPDPYIRASILMHTSGLYRTYGEYERAANLLQEAEGEIHKLSDPDILLPKFLRRLGTLHRCCGRYEEAEQVFLAALPDPQSIHRTHRPEWGKLLVCLAELYRSAGRLAEARPLYAQAYWLLRNTLGYWHPETAGHIGNIAEVLRAQDKHRSAERCYLICVGVLEETLGVQHPEYAKRLNNLAQLYRKLGRFTEAQAAIEQALLVLEQLYGQNHHHVAKLHNNLSGILLTLGNINQAEQICRHALHVRITKLGTSHHHTARSYMTLSDIALARQDYQLARSSAREAEAIFTRALGYDHPSTVQARRRIHDISDDRGISVMIDTEGH